MSIAAVLASVVVIALAPAQVGCVAGVSSTPARGTVVSGPPPAPLPETRTPPPGPSAAWVAGYWHWNGSTYSWIPGHWETAPPGTVWYGPTYQTTADGRTFYEPGAFRPGVPSAPGAPPLPVSAPPVNANALR